MHMFGFIFVFLYYTVIGMIGSGSHNNEKIVHAYDQKYRELERLAKLAYPSENISNFSYRTVGK